jgi:predicted transcriptional regulator
MKMSGSEVIYQNHFDNERELLKLPPSCKFILYLLKQKGPMNRKGIIFETNMPDRTVGFAIRMLLKKGFIHKEESNFANKTLLKERRRRHKIDHRIATYKIASNLMV